MKTLQLLFLALTLGSCQESASSELVRDVELGVYYGAQVQERERVSLTLDSSEQVFGFRIHFNRPLEKRVSINWEVEKPKDSQPGKIAAPEGRLTTLGQSAARPGLKQFDQLLPFVPGDPLGIYNVRIEVEGELALDRAVSVVDRRQREGAR